MPNLAFVIPAAPRLRDRPPEGPEWLHEVKFDGWRLQIVKEARTVRLLTRNATDVTARFPAIATAAATLPVRSAIIDAELVAIGADGLPDFLELHRGRANLVVAWCFDLLHANRDRRRLPLEVRKAELRSLLAEAAPVLCYSEGFEDGARLLAEVERMGLEGIISKRRSAPYMSGPRSGWVKVKSATWLAANRDRRRLFQRRT